jgi:hypothetical protein
MKRNTIILCLIAIITFVTGCKKDAKFVDKTTGKTVSVQIRRFDKALFAEKHTDMDKYLDEIRKDYSDLLFSPELNENLKALVVDTIGQKAYSSVINHYNYLSWLEKNLTDAFVNLQKTYPQTTMPRFYTMIAGPARYDWGFANRVFALDSCVVVNLDWYCLDGELNKVYGAPQYMVELMDSAFLAVDIVKTYLREVTTIDIPLAWQNADADLLSLMIEQGKFSWITGQLIGCDDWTALRYTKAQWDWCEANEANLWGFLVQNKMLFEKERMKVVGVLTDAPSSKGLEGSPARIAEYLGYKIVKQYAESKKTPFNVLFAITDANKILKDSNYKPKK